MTSRPPFPKAILGVDPGGSVGFATMIGDPLKKSSYKAWMVQLGPWPREGEPPKDEALQVVKDFCCAWRPEEAVVICERFHTAQRQNRYGRFTNELIGAVEGICFAYDMPVLMLINKDRLKRRPHAEAMLGVPHNPNHDRDDVAALSHVLSFISRISAPPPTRPTPNRTAPPTTTRRAATLLPPVSSPQTLRGRVGTATSKIKRMQPHDGTISPLRGSPNGRPHP